jgi:hypothetical protein
MGTSPRRLVRTGTVDLPVLEASALASRVVAGRLRVLVVGDRSAHLGVAAVEPGDGLGGWDTLDLATLDGWPNLGADSQFEAIAADGGHLVAVMSEDPPVVLVGDTRTRSLRARVTLTAPAGSPLHGKWDDRSSRGEGMVLLRNGRLLVAKEKRPRALVEFCPAGTAAHGISADDFIGPDEEWDPPVGEVDYAATSMWRLRDHAKKASRDISALAVGPDHSLWLLSDKSRAVGRLALTTPLRPGGSKITGLDELWRLPKGAKKPEGMVVIDQHRLLVASDTKSIHDNGIIVERPG